MKTNVFLKLLLCFFSILFFSCEEIENETDPEVVPTENETTKIEIIIKEHLYKANRQTLPTGEVELFVRTNVDVEKVAWFINEREVITEEKSITIRPELGKNEFCVQLLTADQTRTRKKCISYELTKEMIKRAKEKYCLSLKEMRLAKVKTDNGVYIVGKTNRVKEAKGYSWASRLPNGIFVTREPVARFRVEEPGIYTVIVSAVSEKCTEGANVLESEIEITEEDLKPSVDPCEKIDFDVFVRANTLVIKAPIDPLNSGVTYSWDIHHFDENNEVIDVDIDANGSDNTFGWELRPGIIKFCLKIKSDRCPGGIVICKKIILTRDIIERINNLIGDKEIKIEKGNDGTLEIKLID